MEEKGKYVTEEQPANSNPSPQDGKSDTSETRRDLAAILASVLGDMRQAGWKVELRQDNAKGAAYIVFPDAHWESIGSMAVLRES